MKFPPWLEAHRGELSVEQAAAYEVQIDHIEGVCGHLETHGDSQFDALLARLQKVRTPQLPAHLLVCVPQRRPDVTLAFLELPTRRMLTARSTTLRVVLAPPR